jgi:translation initiation factor IF-3
LSRPFPPRQYPPRDFTRVNNKIRAREVRVIGEESEQLGVMSLNDALAMARQRGVDLVEIAAAATPPVCRLVDYGKFRYEQSKKDKESKKHQHANKVKEIQLSANIDPHDFGVKLTHAIDFLCEDMKVKVSLRFRGREMAHQEFGFAQVNRFIKDVSPWGHPDAPPKLIGKGLNVMLSPLPRNKRARNPNEGAGTSPSEAPTDTNEKPPAKEAPQKPAKERVPINAAESNSFGQNPFASMDLNRK